MEYYHLAELQLLMCVLHLLFIFCIQVHKISQADINAEIIFNCQMGRGRTTTGMVIATLIYLNRIGASGDHLSLFAQIVLLLILLIFGHPKEFCCPGTC